MGLFNNWPYTNLHELNLDWIIQEVKKLATSYVGLEADFNKLKEDVYNFLDTLDIDKAVSDKLTEWKDDGTLEAMIRDVFEEILENTEKALEKIDSLPKNGNVSLYRYGRLLDDFARQNRNQVLGGQACVYYKGQYFTCGLRYTDNKQVIAIWNEQGMLQNSYEFSDLGHGNAIAVDDTHFYVVSGSDQIIHKIDRSDLTEIAIAVPDIYSIIAITMDENGNIFFYGRQSAAEYYAIYKFNPDNTWEQIIEIDNIEGLVPQGFTVFNNIAYVSFNQANQLYSYNLIERRPSTIFNIPAGDFYQPIGELENPFWKDGGICLAGVLYTEGHVTDADVIFMNLFKTDILEELSIPDKGSYFIGQHSTQILVNGNGAYLFNPDTTTFTTVEEACAVANYVGAAVIRLSNLTSGIIELHDGEYALVGIEGSRRFKKLYVQNAKCTITGLEFSEVCDFRFANILITNSTIAAAMSLTTCDITFNRCSFVSCAAIDTTKANIVINQSTSDLPITCTITKSLQNNVEVNGRYSNTFIKYAELGNSVLYITLNVYSNAYMMSGPFTVAQLEGSTEVVRNIYNCSPVNALIKNADKTLSWRSAENVITACNTNDSLIMKQVW